MIPGSSSICAALLVIATSAGALGTQHVNPHTQVLEDFEARIRQYTRIQQQAETRLPALKPTDAPEKIRNHEQLLAQAIRRERSQTKQGDVFAPEISREFQRLIGIARRGSETQHMRATLKHAEPVNLTLHVNDDYPENVQLQTTPPTLLLNLPKLPPGLEYRVVGRTLVLRDTKANLIVDFIPNALSPI